VIELGLHVVIESMCTGRKQVLPATRTCATVKSVQALRQCDWRLTDTGDGRLD